MTEQNPETPLSPESAESTKEKKKGGCLGKALAIGVFALAALMIAVFVLDKMNVGLKTKARDFAYKVFPPPKAPKGRTKIVEKIVKVPVEKVVEKIVEVEVKPPMPSNYIPYQKVDTAKLWNGIKMATSVDSPQGGLASAERLSDQGYQIEMKVSFKTPVASQSIDALAQLNPNLPAMLPRLGELIANGKVSPFYHQLYQNKASRIQQKATRLDQLLSNHNLYDTETILELEDPETKQKALLIQSDMDVVSDGSDGDRWPFLDNYISMSQYYQPSTSYKWIKRTGTPNPLLKSWESDLKKYKEEFAIKGLSIERNRFLRSQIDRLTVGVGDMKYWSYLIAEADPFIVMSLEFLGRGEQTEFAPFIGDYAVVIYKDKMYPSIVGDAGPTYKFGEASLRMAREINPKSSPYNRPVSELGVTYIVFPASREDKKTPPDLEVWRAKCQAYLDRMGGIGQGYQLHQWDNIIPKKLEEWKAKNPGATIVTTPLEQEPVDPATLPQPSFSTPPPAGNTKEASP